MANTNEWTERASATNATATATRAADPNHRHIIDFIYVSFSAAAAALLTVKKGTDIVLEHYVHNADVLALGLRGDVNEAVSAELAAGGAAVVGKCNIIGRTGVE